MSKVVIIAHQAESLINFRGLLIKAIVAEGHTVITLAPDFSPGTRAAIRELGGSTIDYDLSRTGLKFRQDLRSILQLKSIIQRIQPDITFSYAIKPVIYGTFAAWLVGVPQRIALVEGLGFVFTDNGHQPSLKLKILRQFISILYKTSLAKAHKVFFLNPDDVREFVESNILEREKTRCVGGIGVDLVEWHPTPFPVGVITFTLAGRLLREKGILEYISAARLVKAKFPNVRFLLLGGLDENPGALSIENINAWVEEGIVEWVGHAPMQSWLAHTSVYVLPSYREGVPRSTQEAMAMGRPVITTDVPGCRETVIQNLNGYLIAPQNAAALADAMERFIKDPLLIQRMGAESRRIAEERFDVHKINSKLLREMRLDQIS